MSAEGVDEFWTRRVRRTVGGADLAVLCPVDAVGYAALHLLKHLLHGDTKPFHVYEIASFLHGHADDEAFWTEWRGLHSSGLRRLQTVSFLLAEAWFGCRLAPAVREEAERLPRATRMWFERVRHLARRAALSPQQGRTVAASQLCWIPGSTLCE